MATNRPRRRAASGPRGGSRRAPRGKVNTRPLAIALAVAVVAVIAWLVITARAQGHDSAGALVTADAAALETAQVPDGTPEELLRYKGFTVSFNPKTHQPNWVGWELLASEVGGEHPRNQNFAPDTDVEGCADPRDYRHSGFDRGHMAPAGDMKWDADAMRESFLMTNICPQSGDLNRGAWNKLEEKCRQRARRDSAVVIVCGPVFDKSGASMLIGSTGVAVPKGFFKVVLSPYSNPPKAIGFLMPNGPVKGGMQACAVPVDSVESVTGIDFFAALPDEIETDVEKQCDFHRWSTSNR
ncbi:MAG: DNA/RNA non-specific endonuclease [Bacteroides sp.]|nr:DNA/RNA non-specific endonuclease [Bacteroides sp.]